MDDLSPAEHWEKRYAESDRVWSGRVNPTLESLAADLTPGRALDLGCGEGGDVLWLAQRGWRATGVDISATAVARARAHAEEAGLPQGQAEFVAAELPQGIPDEPFDLITASFLQSTVELDRQGILEAAAARVAPGGRMLIVSHAEPPPWANHEHGPRQMPTVEGDLRALAPVSDWHLHAAENRRRSAVGPDGQDAVLEDVVIFAQRIG